MTRATQGSAALYCPDCKITETAEHWQRIMRDVRVPGLGLVDVYKHRRRCKALVGRVRPFEPMATAGRSTMLAT